MTAEAVVAAHGQCDYLNCEGGGSTMTQSRPKYTVDQLESGAECVGTGKHRSLRLEKGRNMWSVSHGKHAVLVVL